jgi:hypothetical protein
MHLTDVASMQRVDEKGDEAARSQQIDPNDKRTARELLDELYDEHGLPK